MSDRRAGGEQTAQDIPRLNVPVFPLLYMRAGCGKQTCKQQNKQRYIIKEREDTARL